MGVVLATTHLYVAFPTGSNLIRLILPWPISLDTGSPGLILLAQSWMVQCPEAHLFCRDCARRSAEECIGNRKTELVCMDQSGCKLPFAESEVERFLSGPSLELWHRIKQEREIELVCPNTFLDRVG